MRMIVRDWYYKIDLETTNRARIVGHLIGQLSDGIWEESSTMPQYFNNMEMDGTILVIRPSDGFKHRDEKWVKNWLANKIRYAAKLDMSDNAHTPEEREWSRDNLFISTYLGNPDYGENFTISEIYECFDFLKDDTGHSYAFRRQRFDD